MEDIATELTHPFDLIHQDGVYLFKNQVSIADIEIMNDEISKIRQHVMKKILGMKRPLPTYSDIAERQLDRLDYRCGFTAKIFNDVAKPIVKIIQQISPKIDFRHYWGAIPSLAGSGPTDLHRDIYPILNTTQGNDLTDVEISLPPYYYTVLIPLVAINQENGPTEFVKGSHRQPKIDEATAQFYAPNSNPGDLIIFDGRTMHRGCSNNSKHERLIAYITFVANWYHDQTFKINNYLFPELAQSGQ